MKFQEEAPQPVR